MRILGSAQPAGHAYIASSVMASREFLSSLHQTTTRAQTEPHMLAGFPTLDYERYPRPSDTLSLSKISADSSKSASARRKLPASRAASAARASIVACLALSSSCRSDLEPGPRIDRCSDLCTRWSVCGHGAPSSTSSALAWVPRSCSARCCGDAQAHTRTEGQEEKERARCSASRHRGPWCGPRARPHDPAPAPRTHPRATAGARGGRWTTRPGGSSWAGPTRRR